MKGFRIGENKTVAAVCGLSAIQTGFVSLQSIKVLARREILKIMQNPGGGIF
jgi:hypothetical protein